MAFDFAIRTIFMIDCTASRQAYALLEHGTVQRRWQESATFCQFMRDCFPTADAIELNNLDSSVSKEMRAALTANKLSRHLGVRFVPTDDLKCHLEFDRKMNTISIFHNTAFLKEHLRLTKGRANFQSFEDCLQL
jgi:hypothetical protein